MALNPRLTQNIDLQADGTALRDALRTIGTEINKIVDSSGKLNQNLAGGADKANVGFQATLKTLRDLVGQATTLQNVLDASLNKRSTRGQGLLDEQSLGKKSAAVAQLSRDLSTTETAANALEKRLTLLNARFADLGRAGRTVSRNDLSKQFKIEEALKQVNSLQSALTRLNGKALNTPSQGNSPQMAQLKQQIDQINSALLATAQNTRKTNFQPQIDQLRALIDQYQKLINVEIREAELSTVRGVKANTTAQNILNQSDAQRAAQVQKLGSNYQFPSGISSTVSQKAAEDQLAVSLQRRLALLGLIQKAQETGASVAVVDRLNKSYQSVNEKIAEQQKLLTTINKEQANTFLGKFQTGLGYAGKIAGASLAVTGVFAVINAFQSGAKFVVDYDEALKNLQAISGSTDTQMRTLAGGINEVSRSSNASVLDITKAAQVIAQAGYSAKETVDVLKASLTLSTAAGVDPQKGADVITSTLGAFQLQASESGRVADVLTTALNRTKLSLDQVQAAIQYAGATAEQSNVSFDELTTIISTLAQAGIKSGSTIGTGLRQLFVDLQEPTEKFKKNLKDVGLNLSDVDLRTKGFVGVIRTLSAAGFGATQAFDSFENRSAAAFLAFKGQLPIYDELAQSIARGGTAAEAQATAMDSLGAQAQRLTNDLSLLISGLASPLVSALKLVTSLFANMTEALGAMFAPLTEGITKAGTFGTVLTTLVLSGLTALVNPLAGVAVLLIGLASALDGANKQLDELKTKTEDSSASLTEQKQTVASVEGEIERLVDRQGVLKDGSVDLQVETSNLSSKFEDLVGTLGKAYTSYQSLIGAMEEYRRQAISTASVDAQAAIDSATVERTALKAKIDAGPSALDQLSAGTIDISSPKFTKETTKYYKLGQQALESTDPNQIRQSKKLITDYSAANNNILQPLITLMEQRLSLLSRMAQLDDQIANRTKDVAFFNEQLSPNETTRFDQITRYRGATNDAIAKAQSGGGLGDIQHLIDLGNREVKALQEYINNNGGPTSAKGRATTQDLQRVNNELARLNQALRAAMEEKPDKAKYKGADLLAPAVAADIRKQFPGANVYGTSARSLKDQTTFYNNYKAGKGPLAAKPGTSYHGTQHAVDMTPIPGMSIDDVVSYVESLGLEVVEKKIERNPSSGGVHWHVAWKPRTSNYESKQNAALKSLQDARASSKVGEASARIQAILAQARAGVGDPGVLKTQLSSAVVDYSKAVIDQYDTQHPVKGLTGAALEEWKIGRKAVVDKVAEDTKKFQADFFKQVADYSKQLYDEAIAKIDQNLNASEYNDLAGVRASDQQNAIASSRKNRGKIDPGTQYYLDKQSENAQLNSDRLIATDRDNANIQKAVALDNRQQRADLMPEGPDKQKEIADIRAEWDKLTDSMSKNDQLWESINARTQRFIDLPLAERLKYGAQAWLEQSGAMDSYKDVLAKNVGPALDMVSSQLTDMFVKLAEGQITIKKALLGMLQAIGEFILKLIAKALALAAIKWFLKLIGIDMPDSGSGGLGLGSIFGGGSSHGDGGGSSEAQQQKTGGMAGQPVRLMAGGSASRPYITEGNPYVDTVPALLARDEFVMRSKAVKDIGVDNMQAMNKYGAKALKGIAGTSTMIAPQAKQEVNVYVVKPDEKPQVTKNDIILAVTDDMLQGGQTKQLVRQISQGA